MYLPVLSDAKVVNLSSSHDHVFLPASVICNFPSLFFFRGIWHCSAFSSQLTYLLAYLLCISSIVPERDISPSLYVYIITQSHPLCLTHVTNQIHPVPPSYRPTAHPSIHPSIRTAIRSVSQLPTHLTPTPSHLNPAPLPSARLRLPTRMRPCRTDEPRASTPQLKPGASVAVATGRAGGVPAR